MEAPSTSQGKHAVHLEKVPKKRRGKPQNDLLNVVRRAGGGKEAFRELKYNDLLDLYNLWCGYFQEIVDLLGEKLDIRLLKADYHGCLLRVTHATNPSQIGLYGIVAHESRLTFQLVTRQDRVIEMVDNSVAAKDQELCSRVKKFYAIYYEAMDSRRDKLSYLYTAGQTPSLTWNGHHVEGVDAIRAFNEQLPKTEHRVSCVNPQSIEVPGHEGWAIVPVMGTVDIGGQTHGFTHTFVMVPENNALHILDEQYRFID